jgi:hypothetical protein
MISAVRSIIAIRRISIDVHYFRGKEIGKSEIASWENGGSFFEKSRNAKSRFAQWILTVGCRRDMDRWMWYWINISLTEKSKEEGDLTFEVTKS